MIKPLFRTPYNYMANPQLHDTEIPYGKTLTTPNGSLSVREQLQKFQTGRINGMAHPIYMDYDDACPDFTKMDQIEIINWREEALLQEAALQSRFKKASQALAKQQEEERLEQAVQQRLRDLPDPSPTD